MEIILIIVISIVVSAFGTIVGFGGGVFMVPILIIFFHVPINVAIGSVILALFPGSLISTYFNYKEKKIDYISGIFIEIPTIFGTILGAYLTAVLPIKLIEITFSIFICGVGIYMFNQALKGEVKVNKNSLIYKLNKIGPGIIRKSNGKAYRLSYLLSGIFGISAGILAGFFGIGGGFLKIPIMVNIFNIPPIIASATALFMIVFTSLTGSITHYLLGHINFTYSLPIVIGFIIGAFTGNFLNFKISETILRKLIGVGLLLAGLSVLIFAVYIQQ